MQPTSLVELARRFPDDATAEQLFIDLRWPDGVTCPSCQSRNIHTRESRKPAPFRCRDCRKDFSVKTDSLMHGSNLGYRVWAFAFFLMASNPKGISSIRLGQYLGITQKTAWYLAHRIRDAYDEGIRIEMGPVEVDETYVGGKEKNKHWKKKIGARGSVGKAPVVGLKDRATNHVSAAVVETVDRTTLHGFVYQRIAPGIPVYTDDLVAYKGLPCHESVNHSRKRYVNGDVHTNGIESVWAILKRSVIGVYHQVSRKHLPRYVRACMGRYNMKSLPLGEQMEGLIRGIYGKRLSYAHLTLGIP
jgi:transposase-like protein